MKKRFLILLLTTLLPLAMSAQDDIGLWLNGDISFKIMPKLQLELAESFRLRESLGEIDRSETSLELSYKLSKFLKVGGVYDFIYYNHSTKDWESRHRYKLYVTGDVSLNRFNISIREMFQSTFRVGVEETSTRANPKMILRSRIMAEYDIKGSKLVPYISAEYYNTLNDPVKNELVKTRYTAGVKYRLNKRNCLELFYRHISEKDEDDIEGSNILGIGYSYKL
ncbi:MAG: DUF2490 domain-containing protein [Rikenellaceae bacterium]|nr:DUF2490 domain-containing protein [Rikenellaceae bacterium]